MNVLSGMFRQVFLLSCTLLLLSFSTDTATTTYSFGDIVVEAGPCREISGIQISRQGREVYSECSEAIKYFAVDTMSLNEDYVPDFILGVLMEEYFYITALVSKDGTYTYGSIEITPEIFPADTYSSEFKLGRDETFKYFVLTDADEDGRKDIVTNVIRNGKQFRTMPKQSDTFTFQQIKEKIKAD